MKLSFWAKFAVLMLALVAGQCMTWLIHYRSEFGFDGQEPDDRPAASRSAR
jgi:hypothetical protein